ncbi:MAG: glutathione S-transferase family protein [Minwuia sp.]|nr:glutathione S-transferase family protein [Minwuia sp.]
MKLIGGCNSPYVRRVAVTLAHHDLPFAREDLVPFGDDKAEVRKYNPLGRVPALVLDDGEVLVESGSIIDHLDSLVGPERALTPATGSERRRVLNLVSIASGATDKLVSALYEHHLRPADMVYRPWAKMCDRQFQDGFQWLESQLTGDWFVGDRMSQADLSVAVFWQFALGKRPNFIARMNCSRLSALSDRLAATAAFLAAEAGPGLARGLALDA